MTKPRTMTAEREEKIRADFLQCDIGPNDGKDLLIELDAERAAHSQTIQAAEKLVTALETILRYRLEDDCEICNCGTDCSQCVARDALAQWTATKGSGK